MANVYTSGTNFSFAGNTYTVTSLTYSMTSVAGEASEGIDVSHLGLTVGASMLKISKPLSAVSGGSGSGREVSIEYLGASPIADNSTGTLVITGATSLSASAICMSSSVTLATNDIVRGSATFKVARV